MPADTEHPAQPQTRRHRFYYWAATLVGSISFFLLLVAAVCTPYVVGMGIYRWRYGDALPVWFDPLSFLTIAAGPFASLMVLIAIILTFFDTMERQRYETAAPQHIQELASEAASRVIRHVSTQVPATVHQCEGFSRVVVGIDDPSGIATGFQGSQRVLCVGLFLCWFLPRDQLAAAVAHEVAHYQYGRQKELHAFYRIAQGFGFFMRSMERTLKQTDGLKTGVMVLDGTLGGVLGLPIAFGCLVLSLFWFYLRGASRFVDFLKHEHDCDVVAGEVYGRAVIADAIIGILAIKSRQLEVVPFPAREEDIERYIDTVESSARGSSGSAAKRFAGLLVQPADQFYPSPRDRLQDLECTPCTLDVPSLQPNDIVVRSDLVQVVSALARQRRSSFEETIKD